MNALLKMGGPTTQCRGQIHSAGVRQGVGKGQFWVGKGQSLGGQGNGNDDDHSPGQCPAEGSDSDQRSGVMTTVTVSAAAHYTETMGH